MVVLSHNKIINKSINNSLTNVSFTFAVWNSCCFSTKQLSFLVGGQRTWTCSDWLDQVAMLWKWWITAYVHIVKFYIVTTSGMWRIHLTLRSINDNSAGGGGGLWRWCVKYRIHMECTGGIKEAGWVQLRAGSRGINSTLFPWLGCRGRMMCLQSVCSHCSLLCRVVTHPRGSI